MALNILEKLKVLLPVVSNTTVRLKIMSIIFKISEHSMKYSEQIIDSEIIMFTIQLIQNHYYSFQPDIIEIWMTSILNICRHAHQEQVKKLIDQGVIRYVGTKLRTSCELSLNIINILLTIDRSCHKRIQDLIGDKIQKLSKSSSNTEEEKQIARNILQTFYE